MSEGEVIKLADLDALDEVQRQPSSLKRIRDHHHLVARLIAEGRRTTDVAFETGLSISRVSILKNDPAFQQLVEVYRCNRIQTIEAVEYETRRKIELLKQNSVDKINEMYEEEWEMISHSEARADLELSTDLLGQKVSKSITLTGNLNESLADRLEARKRRADQLSGAGETPALPAPTNSKE